VIQESNANVGGDARGCGERLREARLAAGLDLQDVAARLHMPVRVVESLEKHGKGQATGAPVFVRGQLRSYAKLLQVDLGPLLEAEVAPVAPVELVSHSHVAPWRRAMESIARRAVYVVITAAIAVPVWFATRTHFAEQPATASLDAVPSAGAPHQVQHEAVRLPAPPVAARVNDRSPYVASLAPPVGRSQGTAASPALSLVFEGDSWMQVTGDNGRVLEQGLMRSGQERSFKAGEVTGIVLGNASAVRVQQDGSKVDLTPYQRANVARFAVSSDGSVAPAQ